MAMVGLVVGGGGRGGVVVGAKGACPEGKRAWGRRASREMCSVPSASDVVGAEGRRSDPGLLRPGLLSISTSCVNSGCQRQVDGFTLCGVSRRRRFEPHDGYYGL